MSTRRHRLIIAVLVVVVLAVAAAGLYWLQSRGSEPLAGLLDGIFGDQELPQGIAGSNGRIEAIEVDVASRLAGRLTQVHPREGDRVEADSVVAHLDTERFEAKLRQAKAELRRSRQQRKHAEALVAQRNSELEFARRELERLRRLSTGSQYVSEEAVDQARTEMQTIEAALRGAEVQVVASEAAIEAAEAAIDGVNVDIEDTALRAPRSGRVLYRLAEPGEIVGVGGKVLTLLDLSDVYMVIFLPETVVGRIPLNAEARIVLDAAPDYVIPAHVSFVAARAQFTPKQVETRSAREKLSFRVKLQIAPELLARYEPLVKTGVPGVAYVRLDEDVAWPDHLKPRLPQWNTSESTPSSN